MRAPKVLAAVFALTVLIGLVVRAGISQTTVQTGKTVAKKSSSPKPKPEVFKIEKKPFKVEITVKGNLEPEEAAEVYFRPEPIPQFAADFAPLIIEKVVEHGSTVRQGDVLIAFDTRKLELVIKDAEAESGLLDTNIKLAQDELPLSVKSMPIEMATAERAKKLADEDIKYFHETGQPQAERFANLMVKEAAFYLESAQEELRQLEKMYKSKDLTEETEQIILKRHRFYVDLAKEFVKEANIRRDYTLKVVLPRKDKDFADNVVQKGLALEKAQATLGPGLTQKRQALAKLLVDRAKLTDRLDKLHRDRERLALRAPMDGVVYYGRLHQGQWTSASAMAGKLAPKGIVSADETLMTVVKPKPLRLRLTIEEKDIHMVRPGLQGRVQLVFQPELKLKANVAGISSFPIAPGQFEALVALDQAGCDALVPGLACTVKFVPYSRKDAVAVPVAAVTEEDDKHFVTVVHPAGKKEHREVTTGKTANDYIEIVSGLHEGEEIVKDEKKDKS